MDESDENIDYAKWKRVVTTTQLILMGLIFVIEALNNAILYVTRSQGYGPETIVEKLLRYFVLTTAVNVAAFAAGQWIVRRTLNVNVQKIVLVMVTEVICTNVAFSHYQFSITFATILIPTLLCILYEDVKLLHWSFAVSLVGLAFAGSARAMDAEYNQYAVPEVVIAAAILLGSYLISKIVLQTLKEHSREVRTAQAEVAEIRRKEELAKVSIRIMDTLAQTIDAKDKYTNGHSFRVSVYSTCLAKALGYSDKDVEVLRCDALLHDIGKIGVPDAILNNPGRLSPIEFDVIKSHAAIGAEILKDLAILPYASEVAGEHHERYDGKGYPNGKRGDDIAPFARIVSIADAYDAMSSDRIYRKALSREVIRKQLVDGRGTQFDPKFLDAFLKLFDDGLLEASQENPTLNLAFANRTVLNDVALFVESLSQERSGAAALSADGLRQIFAYTKQLERRYKSSFELIVISAETSSGESLSTDDERRLSDAIDVAIRKNIRMVDVYTRFSSRLHLILLTNVGENNVDMIIRRISFDYGKQDPSGKFRLTYECKKGNPAGCQSPSMQRTE